MEEKTLGQLELDLAALSRAEEIIVDEKKIGNTEFAFERAIEEYEELIQKKKDELGII